MTDNPMAMGIIAAFLIISVVAFGLRYLGSIDDSMYDQIMTADLAGLATVSYLTDGVPWYITAGLGAASLGMLAHYTYLDITARRLAEVSKALEVENDTDSEEADA